MRYVPRALLPVLATVTVSMPGRCFPQGEEVIYGNATAPSIYDRRGLKFTTNDSSKSVASFVMLNDIHGNTDYIPKLLAAADFKKTDMVIYNGDMLNNLLDEEELFKGFMDISIDMFATCKPLYYARGNHETRGSFATSFHRFSLRRNPICIFDTAGTCLLHFLGYR